MNMTAAALRINTLDGENFELIESIKTKEKIATKANRETNDGGAVKNQKLSEATIDGMTVQPISSNPKAKSELNIP